MAKTKETKSPPARKAKTKLEKLRAQMAKDKKDADVDDVGKQTQAERRGERLKVKKYIPKPDEVEKASREEVELREFFSELADDRVAVIAENIDIFVDRPYEAPLKESIYEDLEAVNKEDLRKMAIGAGLSGEGMKRDIIREMQKNDKHTVNQYDELNNLSKDELQDMCEGLELPITGTKVDMIKRLITGDKAPWSRKQFFERLRRMPPQMILTFAKSYISQNTLSGDSYLNVYLGDDEIQKKIAKLRGKMWMDELEEENDEFAGQKRQQKLDALAQSLFDDEVGGEVKIGDEIYGQSDLNELVKPRKGREKGRRSKREVTRRSGKKTRDEIAADVEATKARVNAMIKAQGKRKTMLIAGDADDVHPGQVMQTMFGEKGNTRDKWALDRLDRAGLAGIYPGDEIPIPGNQRIDYGTKASGECMALFRRAPWVSDDANGERGYGTVEGVYIAPAKPGDVNSILPYVAKNPIPALAAKTRLETAQKRQAAMDPIRDEYVEQDIPDDVNPEEWETLPEVVKERLREKAESDEKRRNRDRDSDYFDAMEEVEEAREAVEAAETHPVTIEEDGRTWYKAGVTYFDLVCQEVKWKSKTQFGNILTISINVPSEDNPETLTTENLRVRVGYQTATGFVEQTEKIWQREVRYMRHEKAERTEKLAQYLLEPVSSDAEEVGMNMLAVALSNVAPDNPNYKKGSKYIDVVVKKAAQDSSNVQEFAEKIAGIVVYIDISNIPGKKSIFAKRLAGNYYLPEVLATLSPGEKNPEAFDDPRIPPAVRDRAANNIRFHEEIFLREFSLDMYHKRTRERNRPSEDIIADEVVIEIDPWRNTCVNAKDVENIPDIDLLYYREGEHLYCLSIPELMNRFSKGNYTNPVSRQPLAEDFIFRFQEMYKPASPKVVARPEGTNVIGQKEPLAKGLLRLMKECIAEKEAYMYGEEIESSSEGEFGSTSSDDDEDPEIREKLLDSSSSSDEENYESADSSHEDEGSSPEDEGGNEGKSCRRCDAKLRGRGKFTSIAHDDDGVHVWHFCSRQCCEKQKWPRRKIRKA
jgi:hypothetical protein